MSKGFGKEIARIDNNSQYQLQTDGEAIVRKAIAEGREPKLNNVSSKKQSVSEEEPKSQAKEPNKQEITEEQLMAVAKAAAENAIAQVQKQHQEEVSTLKTEVTTVKEEAEVKVTEAETTAKNAIELANQEAEAKVLEAKQAAEDAIAKAKNEVEEAQKKAKTLEGVFKLTGVQVPNFNQLTNPLKDEPIGAVKELRGIFDTLPTHEVSNSVTGEIAIQKNLTPVRNFIARHFIECREKGTSWRNAPIIKDLEQSMKNHGFFSGSITNAAGPTIGTPGSAGALFLDILFSLLRETHNQHNIFWQFTISAFNAATVPSQTMLVPRWHFLPTPQSIADFELATSSSFTSIAGAIGTATDSQSLEATTVPITVKEYGLGKGAQIGTRPVHIPEFHQQIALLSFLDILDSRLMQNYFSFEELLIREQYEATTVTLYNKAGNVESAPANVAAGDDGTMTEAFANSVYTELYSNQVPTFPDGCYVLVLPPQAANQYKSSLGDQYRPVTEEQKMAVTNTFRMATGVEIGHVNGYIGMYNNFHVFVGNSFGVGAAGAVPTVNNVTFGGGAVDAVDGFVFGPGCVGRGIALGAEIRASGVNPYGRGESFIWLSREGVAPMDMDATIDPNQQTRCYRLRIAKTSV